MKERHSIISSADKMLKEINNIISTRLKTTPRYNSAIVSSVNIDGTVNVYFPPDKKIFTNISNQTPFTLAPGDSVEIILKEGSYNNCWICAKHQTSLNTTSFDKNNDTTKDLQNKDIVFNKNGSYKIAPDTGYDGLNEVNLGIEVPTSGTNDYNDLENLPRINQTVLRGNKTTSDLNLNYEGINNLPKINEVSLVGNKDTSDLNLDYEKIINLPKINNVELIGNKSAKDLGIEYKGLSGLPQINGVVLKGNKTTDQLKLGDLTAVFEENGSSKENGIIKSLKQEDNIIIPRTTSSAVKMSNGENLDMFLPIPTEEDEGKILAIKDGRYQLIEIPSLKRAFTETSAKTFVSDKIKNQTLTIVNNPITMTSYTVPKGVWSNCAYANNTVSTTELNVRGNSWVLATVTTRLEPTFSEGWNLLHKGTGFDEYPQRMYFLSKYVESDTIVSITVSQANSSPIYTNLIAMSNINGFIYHSGDEFISEEKIGSITLNRPNYSEIIWGCSAVWWVSNTHWSCDSLNRIDATSTTGPRQCNFIDKDTSVTTRTFKPGTATSTMAIDYVEVI